MTTQVKAPAPAKKAAADIAAPPLDSQSKGAAANDAPPKVNGHRDGKHLKHKLVRDSFAIPAVEYELLVQLKQRSILLAHPAKKSEVLRAGIMALAAMTDTVYLGVLKAVPAIKTGRPKAPKPVAPKTSSRVQVKAGKSAAKKKM